MDTESVRRWWDYTAAYQRMIEATHTPEAPWYIVPADDKRRARLNLIRHLLDSIPYKKVHIDLPEIPKAQPRPKGATERLGVQANQSQITTDESRTAPVDTMVVWIGSLREYRFAYFRRVIFRG